MNGGDMHRNFALLTSIFLLFLLILSACAGEPTPTVMAQNPTTSPIQTATPAPTVSLPTPKLPPTEAPPTATPTPVVKPPTARPSPTNSPSPTTPSPTPYVVKEGDTLL